MTEQISVEYKVTIEKINSKNMIPIPDLIQVLGELDEGDELNWVVSSNEDRCGVFLVK